MEDPKATVVSEILKGMVMLNADTVDGLSGEYLFDVANFVDECEYGDVANDVKAIEVIL